MNVKLSMGVFVATLIGILICIVGFICTLNTPGFTCLKFAAATTLLFMISRFMKPYVENVLDKAMIKSQQEEIETQKETISLLEEQIHTQEKTIKLQEERLQCKEKTIKRLEGAPRRIAFSKN